MDDSVRSVESSDPSTSVELDIDLPSTSSVIGQRINTLQDLEIREQLAELTDEIRVMRNALATVHRILVDVEPFLETAKTFLSGSKTDKVRAMIRNGRS